MISKTEGTDITTYVYGATDRLDSVQLPDGDTAKYAYDPFGRRVMKQVGTEVTYFLYADEGLIGEYDAGGAFTTGYGWPLTKPYAKGPFYMVTGGQYYFYTNDSHGSPSKMTDTNGSIVWSATYSGFGNATIDQNSYVTNNLRFTGQYFDEETGLHYNLERYYDPVACRYISVDPLGVNGGSYNLFTYVQNNPVNLNDPFGLKSEDFAKMILNNMPLPQNLN